MAFKEVNILANFVEFLPKLLLFGTKNLLLLGWGATKIGLDFAVAETATVKEEDCAELVDLVLREDVIAGETAFEVRNDSERAIAADLARGDTK